MLLRSVTQQVRDQNSINVIARDEAGRASQGAVAEVRPRNDVIYIKNVEVKLCYSDE